ncbi:hypothetical protein C0J52_18302 [Blattella germanica]|nr:hypothetical protein C0J52_18302 [Blattella germanica]
MIDKALIRFVATNEVQCQMVHYQIVINCFLNGKQHNLNLYYRYVFNEIITYGYQIELCLIFIDMIPIRKPVVHQINNLYIYLRMYIISFINFNLLFFPFNEYNNCKMVSQMIASFYIFNSCTLFYHEYSNNSSHGISKMPPNMFIVSNIAVY